MRKGWVGALLGLVLALALAEGQEDHGHGGEKLYTRVAVADAEKPVVAVYDEEGKELGRFTVPSPAALYSLPGGQYVLMVHRDGDAVGFLYGGLDLEDHGEHKDVKPKNPYVAATLRTGPKPTHAHVGEPWLAVFHDGDGTVALFDLRRLGLDLTPRLVATGGADHGAVVPLGETLLVGTLEGGRVEAYTLGGTRVLALPEACPRLHGEAVLGEVAAFGCADGVLLVEQRGRGLVGRKLPYPPGSPQGARVGVLASHPAHPFLVGNFGQGLLFVFPKEGRLEALPLPARPLAFAFDPDGKALYVLTADGRLHRLDPKERRVVASLEAVSPEAQGASTARMAVGHGVAFVTDPVRGEVVRVELDRFQVSGRFSVGGKPRNIALFQVEGVEH
ncbi:hypothetical protein [Thermus sp.]|uniref:hypothetical protein n=1 Tax=Thermus sp. TaxID=275 RepID=UPI003D0BEAC3